MVALSLILRFLCRKPANHSVQPYGSGMGSGWKRLAADMPAGKQPMIIISQAYLTKTKGNLLAALALGTEACPLNAPGSLPAPAGTRRQGNDLHGLHPSAGLKLARAFAVEVVL
jgi:hypothetical protein